jgi:hypothetical protein
MVTRATTPKIRERAAGMKPRIGLPRDVERLHELVASGGWSCRYRSRRQGERLRAWVLREGRRRELLYSTHLSTPSGPGVLTVTLFATERARVHDGRRIEETCSCPHPLADHRVAELGCPSCWSCIWPIREALDERPDGYVLTVLRARRKARATVRAVGAGGVTASVTARRALCSPGPNTPPAADLDDEEAMAS